MIFSYFGIDDDTVLCPCCKQKTKTPMLPRKIQINAFGVDGLPVGLEEKYFDASFCYCTKCGAVWIDGPSGILCDYPYIKIKPDMSRQDAMCYLYEHHASSEYIKGAFYEFYGTKEQREKCWRRFLTHLEDVDAYGYLLYADIYRRLGVFNKAKEMIALSQNAENQFFVTQYVQEIEEHAIYEGNTERIAFPVDYMLDLM